MSSPTHTMRRQSHADGQRTCCRACPHTHPGHRCRPRHRHARRPCQRHHLCRPERPFSAPIRASEIHPTPLMAIATTAAPAPSTERRACMAPTASTADRVNRGHRRHRWHPSHRPGILVPQARLRRLQRPSYRLACAPIHASECQLMPRMGSATTAALALSTRIASTAPTARTAACAQCVHLCHPAHLLRLRTRPQRPSAAPLM